MRAREPDGSGYVVNDGVRVYYRAHLLRGARQRHADARAVLDATGTARVAGPVAIAPNLPLSPPLPERAHADRRRVRPAGQGDPGRAHGAGRGPQIDPDDLPDVEGLDKHGYVPDLFAHLACADAAVVQGGLSTTMELVVAKRPFVYFSLRGHWEQQHFVTHRLEHYRAGIRMDYASTGARDLARAMGHTLQQAANGTRFRPVAAGGAAAAGKRLAALLRR